MQNFIKIGQTSAKTS